MQSLHSPQIARYIPSTESGQTTGEGHALCEALVHRVRDRLRSFA